MFRSDSRTSTKTGVAPVWTTTFAVAGQVIGVVITSSPGPIPSATRVRCIAAVPEETASACLAPVYSANRRSSSAAFSPVVSQPERIVRATASISSSPTAGGWNESMVVVYARVPARAVRKRTRAAAALARSRASSLEPPTACTAPRRSAPCRSSPTAKPGRR